MARETWVQSQVESYQRLKKWYLMPPCLTLSIIRYRSRVKWSNPGKGVAPSPTPWFSKLSKREPSGHPRLWSPTLLTYLLETFRIPGSINNCPWTLLETLSTSSPTSSWSRADDTDLLESLSPFIRICFVISFSFRFESYQIVCD